MDKYNYFAEKQAQAAFDRDRSEAVKTPQAPPFQTFRAEQLPNATVPGCFFPEFDVFPWNISSDNPRHQKAWQEHQRLCKLTPPEMRRLLTARQEAFCVHYASTRNAAAAARMAGWKAGSAATVGHRLLIRLPIRHRIAQHMMFQTLHDQATPAQALALIVSALNGGPDPDLRLRAAARIMDIYRTNMSTGNVESANPAPPSNRKKKKENKENDGNEHNINTLLENANQLLSTSLHISAQS